MRKSNSRVQEVGYLLYHWLSAMVDPLKLARGMGNHVVRRLRPFTIHIGLSVCDLEA